LGLKVLRSFLRRHRRIALDTSVFIYQTAANPKYFPVTDPVFAWLEHRDSRAVTSTVTMTEPLVQAYRELDQQRADDFYGLLSTYPNLAWIAPNLEIADRAARLRTLHRLHTPDALQAATAVYARMITNDSIFERVDMFETLVLDSLL
jgi:predicted nucleic acid-binding protein